MRTAQIGPDLRLTLIISLCFCKLCYTVDVTCNTTLPLPPPPSHFPGVCSLLSLSSFPSLYFCKLCYAVSVTCNMTLPPSSPTPPPFPGVCSLLSLSYAVSVTCNMTIPPPFTSLPFPWALLTSITLVVSLGFYKPCYAVNVTCKCTTSPPSHSLGYAHLYYSYPISLCFSASCVMLLRVTCNSILLPPPSPPGGGGCILGISG